ncbi:hypothetical protein [Streptomyces sp. Je 1-369]|uniref:hypothetical protein n=1 Tax=Streptomyces sp. Je 1-369 TaxID=2966192 RepID=UPI0022862348|nr:hypothetical protein [Streptomyces sp. Je 1-369]WAL95831.1 hypothetical protein NOO62_15810 [Streptomyces sp. Je 1-369]
MSGALLTRRACHGATALGGGGRRRRPTPYLVLGGLFWLVMSLAYWRVPMCCDFGQHAAVVERLKENLLHPAHPMADLPGEGSAYYSPYAVAQGLFAEVTGLAGWQVVKLAGPLNLLVLLTGIGRFVRVLTPRPWAPVLALLAMVLLWGTRMAWWSGYLGLMSMTGNLGYPSTFAIGLTFWAWAWAGTLTRDARGGLMPYAGLGGLWPYVGLGGLCGLILLVHPISSVGAVIGVVAFAASGRAVGRRALCWTATALTAAVIGAVWPYYSVFSLVGDASVDWIHRQLYTELPQRFWLALLGLPALWLRFRRDRRDPLVLMFALDCAVVAYGWVSGHYTYGRILGLTLVPLQFALAIELAAPRAWGWRRGALAGAAALGACVGFFQIQAGAVVPRALDPIGFDQPPRWPGYGWAVGHMHRGDVVLTNGYYPTRSVPGYGANLVAPAWPDASLDEDVRNRRLAAVRTYLDPGSTRAERTAIVRRYDVRWLLLSRDQRVPSEAVVMGWSPRTGEVLARVGAPKGADRDGSTPTNAPLIG